MWNIMKAQHYQTRISNATFYATIISIAVMCMALLDVSDFGIMSGSMYMVMSIGVMPTCLVIFSLVIVASVCGWDMNDKTINYELLSGHSRAQVYFGRILVAYMWAIIGGMVVTLGPVLLMTVIKGWGNNVLLSEAMKVYFLTFAVYIRWISELALITFLVKNSFAAGFLSYAIFGVTVILGSVLEEMMDVSVGYLFSSTNMMAVADLSNSRNMIIDEKTVEVYSSAVSTGLQTNTVIASCLVAMCCIGLGYMTFRRRDMR